MNAGSVVAGFEGGIKIGVVAFADEFACRDEFLEELEPSNVLSFMESSGERLVVEYRLVLILASELDAVRALGSFSDLTVTNGNS